MKVGKLIVFAAVLGLATGAGAATVNTGTNFAWDISSLAPVGDPLVSPPDLVAFQLTLVNISGDSNKNPQAFDGGGDPNDPVGERTGISTPGGAFLHNEQAIAGFSHIASPDIDAWTVTIGAPGGSALDSYFLSPNMAVVFATAEDDVKLHQPYSPEIPVYAAYNMRCGWAPSLQGTFSLKGVNASPNWNLAYLVVPCGTQIRVDAEVSGGDGVKEQFDFTFNAVCDIIPVPAALPLGFAGLLLAIRRRVA